MDLQGRLLTKIHPNEEPFLSVFVWLCSLCSLCSQTAYYFKKICSQPPFLEAPVPFALSRVLKLSLPAMAAPHLTATNEEQLNASF